MTGLYVLGAAAALLAGAYLLDEFIFPAVVRLFRR